MIETNEPKDGDFIAYVEQLQKESAARLLGPHHSLNSDNSDKTVARHPGKADSHLFAARGQAHSRAGRSSSAAHALSARSSAGRLLAALLTIVLGAALSFYWLLASTSFIVLAVGVALVVWGVRQIKRAAQAFPAAPMLHTEVAKTFGASDRKK